MQSLFHKNNLVFVIAIAMMAVVVVISNKLVQIPVDIKLGSLNLSDLMTWGTLSYPVAFLVTDLTNRRLGPKNASIVVFIGFMIAVILSIYYATPRIALASGTAFLIAHLLDITIFNRLRRAAWWRAPLLSSLAGSFIDTAIFYSLAFAASFAFLDVMSGVTPDLFPSQISALMGMGAIEAPRWISWGITDFGMKMLVALVMLVPYRFLIRSPAWEAAS